MTYYFNTTYRRELVYINTDSVKNGIYALGSVNLRISIIKYLGYYDKTNLSLFNSAVSLTMTHIIRIKKHKVHKGQFKMYVHLNK